MKEGIDTVHGKTKWSRIFPFSRSWRQQRKARKMSSMAIIEPPISQVEEPALLSQRNQQTEVAATPKAAKTRLATQTKTNIEPRNQVEKILAQYPYHDGKGATGWVPSNRSPDRPYPRNEFVRGKRVLAQYPHHDNKGAVKYPVY